MLLIEAASAADDLCRPGETADHRNPLYIIAAMVGWFGQPAAAFGPFIFLAGYYAWTSQDILFGR